MSLDREQRTEKPVTGANSPVVLKDFTQEALVQLNLYATNKHV